MTSGVEAEKSVGFLKAAGFYYYFRCHTWEAHPTGCANPEYPSRHCGSNVNMRCRWQQGRGFSSLPQPIKRHEALKNDAESGGLKCVKKRKTVLFFACIF